MDRISRVIGGRTVVGRSERTRPVSDPSGGVCRPRGSTWPMPLRSTTLWWRVTILAKRREVLFAFRHRLHGRRDVVAATVTAEQGEVLSGAVGENARSLENAEYACSVAELLKDVHTEQATTGCGCMLVLKPSEKDSSAKALRPVRCSCL